MKWAAPPPLNNDSADIYPKTDNQGMNGYQESSISIENEDDLMLSPPEVPNVHVFSLPLIGRMQVTLLKHFFLVHYQNMTILICTVMTPLLKTGLI
jgi:hypothetical protein